ncbi:hypothetical protein [Pseudoalteromonas sp. BMB]|nr:hypothetical protein [Pseudoalteromonas sp. BMB]
MPVFIWPLVTGIGGLIVGSSMGSLMRSVVKIATVAGLAYGAFLLWGQG